MDRKLFHEARVTKNAVYFLLFIVPVLAIVLALLGIETLSTNLLGWFLLLTGMVYAAGVVIVAFIRRERFWETQIQGDTVQAEQGDRSFWLITLAMLAVFYVSPLEYTYLPPRLPRHDWMEVVGMTLFILGAALFVWARRTLGKSYSGHLSVQAGQQLVRYGPYRAIRHPAYAGYLLMTFGIAIGYSSLAGMVLTVLVLLPCMLYRIHVEDALLAQHFGEQFDRYRRQVKRLIPGIW